MIPPEIMNYFQIIGFGSPKSLLFAIISTLLWLVIMILYTPIADKIASYIFTKPPTLGAFSVIQRSIFSLLIGIIAAWFLGGIIEETFFRGIILQIVQNVLQPITYGPIANGIAILIAAIGAGIVHLYQGPRGSFIIFQLSILFGLLFVINANNLWPVIFCHGMYDTIAFIRFAARKSMYSK